MDMHFKTLISIVLTDSLEALRGRGPLGVALTLTICYLRRLIIQPSAGFGICFGGFCFSISKSFFRLTIVIMCGPKRKF